MLVQQPELADQLALFQHEAALTHEILGPNALAGETLHLHELRSRWASPRAQRGKRCEAGPRPLRGNRGLRQRHRRAGATDERTEALARLGDGQRGTSFEASMPLQQAARDEARVMGMLADIDADIERLVRSKHKAE